MNEDPKDKKTIRSGDIDVTTNIEERTTDEAIARAHMVDMLTEALATAKAGRMNFLFLTYGTHTHQENGPTDHDQEVIQIGPQCAIVTAVRCLLDDPQISPAFFAGIQAWQERQIVKVLQGIGKKFAAAHKMNPDGSEQTPTIPHPIGPDRGKAD